MIIKSYKKQLLEFVLLFVTWFKAGDFDTLYFKPPIFSLSMVPCAVVHIDSSLQHRITYISYESWVFARKVVCCHLLFAAYISYEFLFAALHHIQKQYKLMYVWRQTIAVKYMF
jgi:hypothetical protein